MPGENCSSGCLTKDHNSYGECLRSKNVRNQWLGGTGTSFSEQKRWSRNNEAYRQARREGLQPANSSIQAVRRAYDAASGGS